jgi:hypothetical protein
MRLFTHLLLFCGLALTLSAAKNSAGQDAATSADAKQLISIEKELDAAENKHDTSVAEKYLASDYVIKSMEGKVYDKQSTIESIKTAANAQEHPEGGFSDFKTAVLGEFALVTFTANYELPEKKVTFRIADVFRKESSGWKLAARTASTR